ncbi:hypothetical protein [Acinetobacter baumannii]|uniref:hypothetical protein n=1 Tax=Acinetobacter baumannii TaxID=470 RepID=UPI0005BC8795|nr:hypothetical protein [Acinetobacter baumannii]MDV4212804.1 hypothetical protein [Acinetobacter baumannii]
MSEFKVGDKVVVKDTPFWPDDHFIQTVKAEHIGQWYMNSWRLAEPAEVQAGFRKGCKAFDDYWYGRSEAEEVKAMELLNDMGDDFPIENRISPLCKSKDV